MTTAPAIEAPLVYGAQLDARAAHPEVAGRLAVRHRDRRWTYRALRDESVRTAHLLLERLGRFGEERPGHVAMLLENHPELLSLYGGCAYAGATLFGVNTGLRGDTLAGVLDQSRSRLLVVDERFWPEVERVLPRLAHLDPANVFVLRSGAGEEGAPPERDWRGALDEVAAPGASLDTPAVDVSPDTNLMVIYTSGTTGLPKGINNNHAKLLLIGKTVASRLELHRDDVGYACMPLFHSNAMFLGFHPAFEVGGALSMRERFSASGFVPDVLRYGATYWNYVGEPVHYILAALERQHGDEAKVIAEVARHPDNHLRYALGNGASPPDIDRFIRWLGLEDMFELYGSTEAAISTFRRKTDPRGSVGEITDDAVRILDGEGRECPPAQLDADGKLTNYAEAVGEICRVAPDTSLFQGYFDNPQANSQKFREGVYHSGDLGHVLIRDGRRYLFFDGRTDDWIRKDGENFSAAQVARLLSEHDDVVLAAAYGAPCPVSDEWVMAALKLREGASFDPQDFHDFCREQIEHGGMDPKWMPDFLRIVSEFEYTQTQKVLVRNLKKVHYDLRRVEGDPIYWRRRGDTTYRRFEPADLAALRQEFVRSEREHLLDR